MTAVVVDKESPGLDGHEEVTRIELPFEPARRILVVEDNEDTRQSFQQLLELALGVEVDLARDGNQALTLLLERPYSIMITDLRMPKLDGMKLIEEIQTRRLPVTVIVTTGHGSIDEAVQAMRMGAYDFLTKPADPQHLCLLVERALRERTLQDELVALRAQIGDRHAFWNILSKCPRMFEIFELIGHIAETTTTVLIEGETGTGKEQVAQAIHQASAKHRSGPFVAVHCAALPETLLESELFGHEKGAFTGAAAQRKGRFELAHGGTLFLDEVGDIPVAMQVKLLRVLQERRFERVGGNQTVEVDVRVIAATNRSLEAMVKEGKFREDLYYRLNVVKIDLPPLRRRLEDIPLLATYFAQKYARAGQNPYQISEQTMERLLAFSWPGNIRQLENALERACVTARGGVIRLENLPTDLQLRSEQGKASLRADLTRPLTEQLADLTAAFEKRYLRKALRKARGHVGRCAKISGLSRRSVSAKIAQYKIDTSAFKPK
jgi:DNA-binding NtrC family response regulator